MKETGANSKNPGTTFISGDISIATDDDMSNVVKVHYTYTTATTKAGKPNQTFGTLKRIIEGDYPTVMKDGADKATKISVRSSIGLNEFYSERNGERELVGARRNEGGNITILSALSDNEAARNFFKTDMLITGTRTVEADPERNLPEKLILHGAIFDFRNALLPIEFSVINPKAIAYFESLEPSQKNPVFTNIEGKQISQTVVRKVEEENAWGETVVREFSNSRKDFVITNAIKEPYLWDDESTLTAADLQNMMATRETYLATLKQRDDAYQASRGNTSTPSVASGGFDF